MTSAMMHLDAELQQLEADVLADPSDPFLRCNLACVLASSGNHRAAMLHLGIAMDRADGAMAAGCVAAAVRQITDEFARLWQLPHAGSHLALVTSA